MILGLVLMVIVQMTMPSGTVVTLLDDTNPDAPVWTDGSVTWTGNPFCHELNLFPAKQDVVTDDGNTIQADTIGACRNWFLVQAPTTPDSPMGLTATIN